MPTANVFYTKAQQADEIETAIPKLKEFIARELTCGDIQLQPNEVSIRLLQNRGNGMLGDVEIEVAAHAFPERIKRQDEICLNMKAMVEKECGSLKDVKVWLILSELGHSWE
jgi:hypothetical protein